MSTPMPNQDQMTDLKNMVKDAILEILPNIIKEVTPIISTIIVEILPIIMKSTANALDKHQSKIEDKVTNQQKDERSFESFKEKEELKDNRYIEIQAKKYNLNKNI